MPAHTEETKQYWELVVSRDAKGDYTVRRRPPAAPGMAPAVSLSVTGTKEPPLPAGPLTYHDFLRWQLDLFEKGYTVVLVLPR